jgi:hypothetical protein
MNEKTASLLKNLKAGYALQKHITIISILAEGQ